MNHGSDNLGRWVWATLRGQQREKLTVVSMYLPNPGSWAAGPASVWYQQRSRMKMKADEETRDRREDPRKQCLLDFEKWTETKIANGHRIIVLTDANQSLTDTKEGYNLGDLVKRCSLLSAMEAKHEGQSLRSVDRGSTTIDHILTYGVETDEIHKAGQFPFGLGFTHIIGDYFQMWTESNFSGCG